MEDELIYVKCDFVMKNCEVVMMGWQSFLDDGCDVCFGGDFFILYLFDNSIDEYLCYFYRGVYDFLFYLFYDGYQFFFVFIEELMCYMV